VETLDGMELRKAFNFGPLRINLSRKGVGYSLGVRGFRVGRSAKGQDYSQTSIPGTGIYLPGIDALGPSPLA